MLLHNPNRLPNGETDEEAIQRKKAHVTIALSLSVSQFTKNESKALVTFAAALAMINTQRAPRIV